MRLSIDEVILLMQEAVVEGRIVAHHTEIFGVDFDLAEVGSTDVSW